MPFELPPAPKRYSQLNESQSRRTIAQSLGELFARMEILEAEAASGGTPSTITAGFTYLEDFLVVSFTDASVEDGAPIISRLWEFGDGTTSTAVNNRTPTHTYPDAGTYTVTLTVTDDQGNSDEYTESITVEEDIVPNPTGAPTLLVWGTRPQEMPAAYDWWNGIQASNMQPSDCVAMLDYCANNGIKTFVRLWRTNFVVDANGNFQFALWQNDVNRYNTPTLRAKIEQRAADGTILNHMMADDILSARLWGTSAPLQGALLDNMAAYSRSLFPSLQTCVRARVFQCGSFNFQHLQEVNAQYVFGRGDVPQGSMTQAQWRAADVAAYADRELNDLAALPGTAGDRMKVSFGMNVVYGGDGTSGIPHPSPLPGFEGYMGASELVTYAEELAPRTYRMLSMWERGLNGEQDPYFNRADIQTSCRAIRTLCDSLGA